MVDRSDSESCQVGKPRLGRMTQFTIRTLALLWLACYLPVYANAYGGWHFLQLCNVGVLLTCVGLFTSNRLLLSMQALATPLTGVLWTADIATHFATGRFLHGGSSYLWDDQVPMAARLLSTYHLILPIVLIAAIYRYGYDKRAWLAQSALAGAIICVSVFLGDVENLNYSQGWPNGRVLFGHVGMHAAVSWALFCILIYLPTHVLWTWMFAQQKRRCAD